MELRIHEVKTRFWGNQIGPGSKSRRTTSEPVGPKHFDQATAGGLISVEHMADTLNGRKSHAREKADNRNTSPQPRKKVPSTSSTDGDDNSMNSKRLEHLHIHDRAPKPGQKRLLEDSADSERRFKHSKSPETLDAHQDTRPFCREHSKKDGTFHQVGSGNNREQPPPTGHTSGGLFQASPLSPDNDRGRSGARHNDKRTNSQDRSTSPPDAGGGGGPDEDPPEGDTSILLQPDTRPITAEQLVNEVKGIYSGLVMVEKKCVEIIAQRSSTGGKLSNDQWQALIALHRTLLHEHHDFFVRGSVVC